MKRLEVFFCGWGERWLLGTLAESGQNLLFEYSPAALAHGIEFSPRYLKLRSETYADFPPYLRKLPGLIADSLPDGWGLLVMDRLFRSMGLKPETVSPLDRLALIADRGMGAFTFEPAAGIDLEPVEIQLLELAHDVQDVIEGRETDALKHLVLLGGSPHGARPKALVQYDPARGAVSTLDNAPGKPWLIKFPGQGEHKEVCAIEHLYAHLAALCGLEMPETRYFDLDSKMAAFGIERFDRQQGMRVPIHSLAGLLHADIAVPNASYQVLLRATRMMTNSEAEVRKAFERCVFNVAFNNRDDHTKNFSYRMDETFSWKLAPCYDLTYNVGPHGYHQMDIEGEALNPGRPHLLQLARTNGLPSGWAEETVGRIVDVASRFATLAKKYPIRQATRAEIARRIDGNCARMR
jgi:serine/threonine-protein kinase HipA